MKISKIFMLFLIFVCIMATVCYAAQGTDDLSKRLVSVQIQAPALKGNMLEEDPVNDLYIYLPPTYFHSSKAYPVIYFFNGFGDDPNFSGQAGSSLDDLIKKKTIEEVILVSVNGTNGFGGTFLVNSPVTGNWEDHVINEVLPYIDKNYRTIAKNSARGIAGFSMGGFAAINLALRHPDVFSVLYAIAPGLFDENGLENAMPIWDDNFKNAYGAVFASNTAKDYPHADIPEMNGSPEDNVIREKWENGFGNLKGKLDDYVKKNIPLKAIRIEYGTNDYYSWIPQGCIYFSKLLTAAKIKHDLLKFNGNHSAELPLLEKDMFPYFSKNLAVK